MTGVILSPGFIAGVTNPTYEEHTSWWDVLCNIDTGKITVSKDIDAVKARKTSMSPEDASVAAAATFANFSLGRSASMSSQQYKQQQQHFPQQNLHHHLHQHHGYGQQPQISDEKKDSDVEFMNEVLASIQAHYGETSIRAKFQDYVFRFVRLAAIYEEQVYHTTKIAWNVPGMTLGYGPVFADEASMKRELQANAQRIEGWRQTISYKYYQMEFTHRIENSCIQKLDVYRQISKLKRLRQIPDQEVSSIYEAFLNNIITHRQMIEVRKRK